MQMEFHQLNDPVTILNDRIKISLPLSWASYADKSRQNEATCSASHRRSIVALKADSDFAHPNVVPYFPYYILNVFARKGKNPRPIRKEAKNNSRVSTVH